MSLHNQLVIKCDRFKCSNELGPFITNSEANRVAIMRGWSVRLRPIVEHHCSEHKE